MLVLLPSSPSLPAVGLRAVWWDHNPPHILMRSDLGRSCGRARVLRSVPPSAVLNVHAILNVPRRRCLYRRVLSPGQFLASVRSSLRVSIRPHAWPTPQSGLDHTYPQEQQSSARLVLVALEASYHPRARQTPLAAIDA